MATELRVRFPGHVEITLFTPPEETSNGADWYWRFEKAGRAIHARVQAKRVQRTEFGQTDQDGFVDLNQAQLEQLVSGVGDVQDKLPRLQAWLATYARFDARPPCGQDDLQRCDNHRHDATCPNHVPSLWITHGEKMLEDAARRRLPVRSIVEKSLRLDCILPCIDGSRSTGPASKGFTTQSGLSSYQDCLRTIEADAQLRKEFEGALRIAV